MLKPQKKENIVIFGDISWKKSRCAGPPHSFFRAVVFRHTRWAFQNERLVKEEGMMNSSVNTVGTVGLHRKHLAYVFRSPQFRINRDNIVAEIVRRVFCLI